MLKLHSSYLIILILFLVVLLIAYVEYSNVILNHEYNMEYKRFERERNEYYKELGIFHSLFEKINKTFQYIWISPSLNETLNSNIEPWLWQNIQTCLDLHPNWRYTIWTDDLVRREFPQLIDLLIAASVPAEISDILRMNILARYGGIYMDTDFLCVRSFEPLLKQQYCTAFAGSAVANEDNVFNLHVSNGLIGAVAGHFLLRHAAKLILEEALGPTPLNRKTGPFFFGNIIREYNMSDDCIYVYNKKLFYQCGFQERGQCRSKLAEYKKDPGIYAIHYWSASWVF